MPGIAVYAWCFEFFRDERRSYYTLSYVLGEVYFSLDARPEIRTGCYLYFVREGFPVLLR